MYSRTLSQSGRIVRFLITRGTAGGWEVREERDSRVVRKATYADWHRVERARSEFEIKAARLEDEGWRPQSPTPQNP
jgi:hypothetical protein